MKRFTSCPTNVFSFASLIIQVEIFGHLCGIVIERSAECVSAVCNVNLPAMKTAAGRKILNFVTQYAVILAGPASSFYSTQTFLTTNVAKFNISEIN